MKTIQTYVLKAVSRARRIARQAIKGLAYKNYYSAKAYHHLRLANLRDQEPPLLVYQMGKVGSLTVVRSLKAVEKTSGLDLPVLHIHFLTHDGIDYVERFFRGRLEELSRSKRDPNHLKQSQELRQQLIWGLEHAWDCRNLRKQVDRGLEGKKWKIVTLVRDPIARNISSFFHLLDYDLEHKIQSAEVEALVGGVERFLEEYDQHQVPLTWYDSELESVFGIDVFSTDFPKSRGYKIYEGERSDVLLLRSENLNECARDAFREFLHLDEFTLVQANVSSEKCYARAYRNFLDSVVLPESYISMMYTSKYTRHFYTEEEINKFKARWRKNGIV